MVQDRFYILVLAFNLVSIGTVQINSDLPTEKNIVL